MARSRAPKLLYPRLALFRQILRAHQHRLPSIHRELGDAYVKEEFRKHRGAKVRIFPPLVCCHRCLFINSSFVLHHAGVFPGRIRQAMERLPAAANEADRELVRSRDDTR